MRRAFQLVGAFALGRQLPAPPPQAAAVPLFRWVVSSLEAGVNQGLFEYTSAQINAIVQSGNGAGPGRILQVVRADGLVVAAYGGARIGTAWLPLAVEYEQK